MGYTTDFFFGGFKLDKPLKAEHAAYLVAFSHTRRMKRDTVETAKLPDPKREAVLLPIGTDGEFFVGSEENFGQNETPSIIDYNDPPATQPNLWCQWVPNDDGTAIVWDGSEKFYDYVPWLEYLV